MAPDDLISTLLLDVSTLIEGKKETKSFIIDAEVKTKLLRKKTLIQINKVHTVFWNGNKVKI